MDYPKSVAGVGLVGGKFSDGDAAQGVPASLDPAKWANQVTDELLAVIAAAGLTPSEVDSTQLLRSVLVKLRSGTPLPTTDIGPIWHDDYSSIMTWQAFTANGAAYTGYASVLIGSLLLDTQPTARAGYVKSGVANLSRTADAALRAWAMHNGVMVALGVWQAGQIMCADNADGTTFRIFDVRGEFLRAWDDGRGADSGRGFGSAQGDLLGSHSHAYTTYGRSLFDTTGGPLLSGMDTPAAGTTEGSNIAAAGGIETRPRNTALLATIKR